MEKKILKIEVSHTDNNFCCGWSDPEIGTVVATSKSLDRLKSDFSESLRWHIEGCLEDGDNVPEYLANNQYELDFVLDVAALLRYAEEFTTMTAISHASGINVKQLSHYATGLKKPRPEQRQRIIGGIHSIGQRAIALQ